MGLGITTLTEKKKRRNHLVLIGIDKYENLSPLTFPVSDCQRFYSVLKNFYGFSDNDLIIKPLFNKDASVAFLFDEISYLGGKNEKGEARVKSDENLIIYFSGHGHFSNNEGYWIPFDAPDPLNCTPYVIKQTLISVSEVIKILSTIKAHHIVLIVDACFSESFTEMEVDMPQQSQIANAEDIPSRWVLTAGRHGLVPDPSPFANALVTILSQNQSNHISINLLGAQLTHAVRNANQPVPKSNLIIEPMCKSLVNTNKPGEFFFHRVVNQSQKSVGLDLKSLLNALRSGTNKHFDLLQTGRFKYL
ncbi:caspase family protein [Dyadobacter sp. CY261]|uniref:caspase family protein n=1 Tax=Dyadobacter sp. CY261 TaxID=2907203 RepID=UPI001F2E4220|nr:caspase family protein [Dyadobacter sp. CY261]MCF0069318.1 caspase family protein [Dyadobacter sp. CY261]